MVNDTKCFSIREIECNKWKEFTDKVERDLSLEFYLREVIYKLAKLSREDIKSFILPDTKIEVKKK